MKKYAGITIFAVGLVLLGTVIYANSYFSQKVQIFSPYTLLSSSWENYKSRFIDANGRVVDKSQGDLTTSEAQSYALLQAVWTGDKTTFDKVWNWTRVSLKRPNDNLLGWRWGKIPSGYGFLPDGGDNSASDADTDIALALILANRRWGDASYLAQAMPIINDIWTNETSMAGTNRYLTAGNWAASGSQVIINPSYFAPYTIRVLAQVDPKHNWSSLIDPGYQLLSEASIVSLDKNKSSGLPPDWIALNKLSGKIETPNMPNMTTNYGFDAMRIPWRVALDYWWNQEPKAKNYLASLSFLSNYYDKYDRLPSGFEHSGTPLNTSEDPTMYATALGYFLFTDPAAGEKIYQDKVVKLYSNNSNSFEENLPYYDENWLWFGSALYLHYLTLF